jgi:hypothetical protein
MNIKCAFLTAVWVLFAGALNAAVVVLNFNGAYDTQGATILGQNGSSVPFSYQITYDTSLDTDTDFIASGTNSGGNVTTHDWYAYSKSGITATNLTFGTQTWTTLDSFIPGTQGGFAADLWFDTDISLAAPTRAWMDLDKSGNYLIFGERTVNAGQVYISPLSFVGDTSNNEASSTSFSISSSVPEPSRCILLFVGLSIVLGRRKRVWGIGPLQNLKL